MRKFVGLFALLVPVAGVWAAPVPVKKNEVVRDRKSFVPYRRYFTLEDKVVGVLVSDVRAMMGQEGRSGPPNAMAFSAKGGSYRWMYVPAEGKALITNLRVQVGKDGGKRQVYPKLNMANAEEVSRWKIDAPYALVEVEVNDGLGAPAIEGFVATKMKRLDGTKEFPFELPKVIDSMKQEYSKFLAESEKEIAKQMNEAKKKAIGNETPNGPRISETMMYVSWLPEIERLRVHFRTKITDGKFQIQQRGIENPRPFPLPPPPVGRPVPQIRGAQPIAFPPPPPRFERIRIGTSFGVEFGRGYEIDPKGRVQKRLDLPFASFEKKSVPPPVQRFPVDPVRPRPLPAPLEPRG